MKRLTSERVNGIRSGYWSAYKKDELVEALAAYEDTGLTPEEIHMMKEKSGGIEWHPVNPDDENTFPPVEMEEDGTMGESEYIIISCSNYSLPCIGRFRVDENGGAFYEGDCDETLSSYGLFVNAWARLPEVYRGEC